MPHNEPANFCIALISDIHGNLIALDAVLKDIQARGGVDQLWVLGDLVAVGPRPVAVLERLAALPNCHFLRGNTDRYVVTGERPFPSQNDVLQNSDLLPRYAEVMGNFSWTQGAVTQSGWYAFLADLPLERRMNLPDGTRLLGVHASPGMDDGEGIAPIHSDQQLRDKLQNCNADLLCVGHTHYPFQRRVDGIHIVNLGSVSNPTHPSLQASYVILSANQSGYQLEHHYVPYDREAVIQELEQVYHPAKEYITQLLRGEFVRKEWGHNQNRRSDCQSDLHLHRR